MPLPLHTRLHRDIFLRHYIRHNESDRTHIYGVRRRKHPGTYIAKLARISKARPNPVKHEAAVLAHLSGNNTRMPVPYPIFSSNVKGYHCLITTKHGECMQRIISRLKHPFNLQTVLMIGIRALKTLQYIHQSGIVHSNITPSNIILSARSSKYLPIFLRNFQNASYSRTMKSTISSLPSTEPKLSPPYIDPRFASLRVLSGKKPSEYDDIHSLFLCLIYMARYALPWSFESSTEAIVNTRTSIRIKDLCSGLPNSFAMSLRRCRERKGAPDYKLLRALLRESLENRGWEDDGCFEWLNTKWNPDT